MKNKYYDANGLLVPSSRINDSLHQLDITEDELIDYLGRERMSANGYVQSHLEMMVAHDNFYSKRTGY